MDRVSPEGAGITKGRKKRYLKHPILTGRLVCSAMMIVGGKE